MRVFYVKQDTTSFLLGRQGENESMTIMFPVANWLEAYPGATIALYNKRPHESESYPVVIGQPEDGYVAWVVGSTELALDGDGECELVAVEGTTVEFSKKWNTKILDSLDGGGDTPGEWESWLTEFTTLKGEAEDAQAAAEAAQDAAEAAAAAIEEMGVAAETLTAGSSATVTKTVDQQTGAVTLTFGIPEGDQGEPGTPGQDGDTPERGVDYWTEEDQAAIVEDAAEAVVDAIIDDTAGDGDTDKTWSADKLTDELAAKYEKPGTGIPGTDLASGVIPDVTGKADKVSSATSGNFAALDSNGNLTDSGHKHSDYLTSHQDISGKANKADTVLDTTLSRGRKANTTVGLASFAFGQDVEASGMLSSAKGYSTKASGNYSSAEGNNTQATGESTHAEGSNTQATGASTHAEGHGCVATGSYSHAQGLDTNAQADQSHTEGAGTIAKANSSHASGTYNVPDSYDSWPEWTANTQYAVGDKVKRTSGSTVTGYHCKTANSDSSFNSSKWNYDNKINYAVIVGNGTNSLNRSNAYALGWDGTAHLMGDVYVGCNSDSTGGTKLAKITDLETAVSTLNGAINGKQDAPETAGTVGQMLGISSSNTPTWYKTLVTPQMYGAVGNGVADDTAAIQAALNANKKVYFPAGTYKITEPLVLANGHTIAGDSKYYSIISAVGCDAIHITSGDQGERGCIERLQIYGDFTTDSKGIKLSHLAPGWTIENVWINRFDYGIYGFNVGHVNNIYIDKCIITGNNQSGHRADMHAGIHLANSYDYQVNAVVIRDCEINYFEKGIIIGGVANSILQSCVQGCEYGIYISPAIGGGTAARQCDTVAMTINGNYMEQINKNCIYILADYTSYQVGFVAGLQITNNYFYKANGSDNSYAVIKLDPGTYTSYGKQPNAGGLAGLKFADVFIGMNKITKPSNCKAYDLKNCLGRDSIIMDSNPGGTTNGNVVSGSTALGIGASLFAPIPVHEKLNFHNYNYSYKADTAHGGTGVATVNADMTSVTLDPDVEFRIYIPKSGLHTVTFDAEATEYPFKIFTSYCVRNARNGNLYKDYTMAAAGLMEDEEAIVTYGRGWQEKNQATSGFTAYYLPNVDADHSWNDIVGVILLFRSYTAGVTVKNIKLTWLK